MDWLITRFADGEPYTQPAGPNCAFATLLPKGEVGDLNVGLVKMTGPTWNEVGRHTDWHQIYILLEGRGRMLIGEQEFPVQAPCLIRIPYDTDHAMRVDEGEHVAYLYVNQHIR